MTDDRPADRRAIRAFVTTLLIVHAAVALPAHAQEPRPVRRQALTPELQRTAFADPTARTLLERARAARVAQDSALRGYDAKSYLRMSIGMKIRGTGAERLLLRTEQAARVRWTRGSGLWVEPTGRRTAFPMGDAALDLTDATPIPYFPGREALWIPSGKMGVTQAEVNENEMLHPLATGAEAYYRYATGDSLRFRLPDGTTIFLRELRITARRPDWRAFVGSFWFDVEHGSLVRAAYRMAAELDAWQAMYEDYHRTVAELQEKARTDTGAAALAARKDVERMRLGIKDKLVLGLVEGTLRPVRANISAITVEYGLYEGRFWLPKLNVAEGEIQAGFMRLPIRWEESFRFNGVDGRDSLSAVPALARTDAEEDTTRWVVGSEISIGGDPSGATGGVAQEDSLLRRYTRRADSLRTVAAQARVTGDTARARELMTRASRYAAYARQIVRRREGCAHDSTYYAGTSSRYDGALRVAVRMPCNTTRLASSPDLPASIYESGEEFLNAAERDELIKALDLSLQPGWGPQAPVLLTGLSFMRYNRIEGFSIGAGASSVLGLGYTAQAVARIGTGDRVPNGELSLSRSNGRDEVRLALFHRLAVANDDWGAPLSVGASLTNLLLGRDEGFYYRTWGTELAVTRADPGPFGARLQWRLFAERQRSAGSEPNTQASLANAIGSTPFERNIDAVPVTVLGAGGELSRTFGVDPAAVRAAMRARTEAGLTQGSGVVGNYGRVVLDGTLSRMVGPIAASFTGALGGAAGDLPPQRAFYVGGLQTVRGQFAKPDGAGRVGDTFWLGRTELGIGGIALRPSLFYDVGWAGPRAEFTRPGRPQSGAGASLSLLDGILRLDVARGIWPETRWRTDLHLEARF